MKQTGIIMSGDHPRLILDDLKTMTRRTWGLGEINKNPDEWLYLEGSSPKGRFTFHNKQDNSIVTIKCPYGQVGDRLWVRETFKYIDFCLTDMGELHPRVKVEYKANGIQEWVRGDTHAQISIPDKWRSSRFMPRWASRILLEITDIRAERLQEITWEDCIKEGIPRYTTARGCLSDNPPDPRWKFIELWDSLNAKRGYGWEKNPWVWVISFRRLENG